MNIYCDESGGVGRGIMTLAALAITDENAEAVLSRFRAVTGHQGELKGSRIDLGERALVFELMANHKFHASVSIAISAVKPEPGEDRGDHDIAIYAQLLEDAIAQLLPKSAGCAQILIDDGRYAPETLALVRTEIAALIGPFGTAGLEVSHAKAGLQLADVIANSFFNRALVTDRQARMAAIVEPFLEDGRIVMQVVD
jgi:Protein of unknown function (DUF3800)